MNILVIDIGGTNVKIWTTGETDKEKSPPAKISRRELARRSERKSPTDWKFDRVSIGYPGDVPSRPSGR